MDSTIMLSKIHNCAFRIDYDNKVILQYDYYKIEDIIGIQDEGILCKICPEIANELERYFNIKLADFNIEIYEEVIEIPSEVCFKNSYDKALYRLITITIKISQNDLPTSKELAKEFNVTVRTIQTDIYKRLSYLPIYKDENHRYYFPDDFNLCDTINYIPKY